MLIEKTVSGNFPHEGDPIERQLNSLVREPEHEKPFDQILPYPRVVA